MEKLQRVKHLLAFGDTALSNVSNFISDPFSMSYAEECMHWLSIAESCKIILQRMSFCETIEDDKIRLCLVSFVGRCDRLFKLHNLNSPHLVYRHNVENNIFDFDK